MKPTHKLLFILCPMLVLGFIYYSSGKLHLPVWGQKSHEDAEEPTVAQAKSAEVKGIPDNSVEEPTVAQAKSAEVQGIPGRENDAEEPTVAQAKGAEVKRIPELEMDNSVGPIVGSVYDKQGFLLHLDTKLPQELEYKYGNLSEGTCKPGYAAAKMATIYPKFLKSAPMFLDRNFKRLAKVNNYLPPFGFKTQERIIDSILTTTKNYGLGEELDSLGCKRCIVVGNGGILSNRSLGSRIDEYDVVVRLNEALVKGYGKDWLRQMVFKEKMRGTDGFWKSVAQSVPREPKEIRILNPYFIQEAAFQFIGLPFNNGLMGKGNIPTLGTVAITMALHNCDEVAVAGFGYDMNKPHAPLHYYESVKMSAIKESWTHNISKEKEFLRKLVKANVITDLTNGI
ncbi:ST3 beta-galactoside alpha-2,3-sialyltransferase 3b isoform X3 [Archocentrus centrarchus]|uniref:ST3 beta-galactoside alpha-2,3-sialyltransferase 3b isoform X3 n=1 Tax=Archocentrus centrarchus TaxID=63155 RepID=UPI0011E9D8E3|nr:CMP-N-acetylneuraminate-beta-1,4-galactoside alpha-2,3-sialyltransferase isoform X3 [Archocentrus centrarchus]